MFARFLKAVRSLGFTGKTGNAPAKRKEARLSLESLERRDTPSAVTYTEPTNDITSVTLPTGDSYRVSGTFRTDPGTTVPWYTDVDTYKVAVQPNSLISFKYSVPQGEDVGLQGQQESLAWQGSNGVDTGFCWTGNNSAINVRASSINHYGAYSFELTTLPGFSTLTSTRPDLQVSNLRLSGTKAQFDYRIVDPVPGRVTQVPITGELYGVNATGQSVYLTNGFFSNDPKSAYYSLGSGQFDLTGISLSAYSKLRVQLSPLSWSESDSRNNSAESAPLRTMPDVRINSAVMENNLLTISATLTGNVTKFQVDLFASANSSYVKGDPNTARQWGVHCTHNGAEGTYTFKVAIGGNGVRLPGAGAAGRPDDYFLFAVADPNSQIAESDETNNVAPMTGWYLGGNDVFVQGGAGADTVKIAADDVNKQAFFSMNGAGYNVKPSAGGQLTFNVRGHGGNDTVDVRFGNGSQRIVVSGFGGDGRNKMLISGSAVKDTATLHALTSVRSSFLSSSNVYGAFFSGFADMEVYGGGGDDTVQLNDSAGDDWLEFRPASATMSDYYKSYSIKAANFNNVNADSLHGGRDSANLYGSSSAVNTFIADPRKATLSFSGQKAVVNYFVSIAAYGKAGGSDTAQLYGSSAYEEMSVDPKTVSLTGSSFSLAANDFRNVTGFSGGGNDKATVICAGNNTFVGKPDQSSLSGTVFTHYMNGFKVVEAFSRGNDIATFYGSSNRDVFKADPASAEMSVDGVYVARAKGFRTVQAYAQSGGSRATLTASGGPDLLKASYIYANLTGVYQGANYSIYVKGFREVVVDGKGNAESYLYDSPNNDRLYAQSQVAYLQDEALSYQVIVKNFRRVRAVSQSGGIDRIERAPGANPSYLEPQGAWR